MIGLSIRNFILEVIVRWGIVVLLSVVFVFLLKEILSGFPYRWVVLIIFSVLCSSVNCFVVGLSKNERAFILRKIPFFRSVLWLIWMKKKFVAGVELVHKVVPKGALECCLTMRAFYIPKLTNLLVFIVEYVKKFVRLKIHLMNKGR